MSADALLTSALEDYLETIYELVRDQKFARVKDIARARQVRAGSVTPAMKRLADLGLIRYVQREYIDLTPEGEVEARRVYARHQLMTRFFGQILGVEHKAAEADACAMEHSLSAEGMDRLTRLFEFLDLCPEGKSLLDRFHQCPLVHGGQTTDCTACSWAGRDDQCQHLKRRSDVAVSELKPGQRGRVTHVNGTGAIRQRMLDMGILPNVVVEVERHAPAGDPIWIKLQGFQLSLRRKEAEAVLVAAL